MASTPLSITTPPSSNEVSENLKLSIDLRSVDPTLDGILAKYRSWLEPPVLEASATGDNSEFLCPSCRNFEWGEFVLENSGDNARPLHMTVGEVSESAQSGCKFCGLLMQRIEAEKKAFKKKMTEKPNEEGDNSRVDDVKEQGDQNLAECPDNVILLQRGYEYFSKPSCHAGQDGAFRAIVRDNKTGDEVSLGDFGISVPYPYWDTLKEKFGWLSLYCLQKRHDSNFVRSPRFAKLQKTMDECCNGGVHEACRQYSPEKLHMPTRVIDCENLCLLETNGLQAPWVSLSHCWGSKVGLKTTRRNYRDMLSGIDIEALPPTLRDAILFSRVLQYRYLWIDSLCIIQPDGTNSQNTHDLEDWSRELWHMGRYYKDSALTLVIESASGDDEGFLEALCRPEPDSLPSFPVCFPFEDSHAAFVVSNQPLGIDPLAWDLFFMWKYPLRQRAWTLQEVILSSRKIHISGDKLVWNCKSFAVDDQHVLKPIEPFTLHALDQAEFEFVDPPFPRRLSNSDESTEEQTKTLTEAIELLTVTDDDETTPEKSAWLSTWYTILEDFQKRSLSVPTDTLPAVSAIAKHLSLRLGYSYQAGVWMNDIMRGLAWSIGGTGKRPDLWRAPSWSWASLDIARKDCLSRDHTFDRWPILIRGKVEISLPKEHMINDEVFYSSLEQPTRLCLRTEVLKYEKWPSTLKIVNCPETTSPMEEKVLSNGIFKQSTTEDLLCEFDCVREDQPYDLGDLEGLTLLDLGTWSNPNNGPNKTPEEPEYVLKAYGLLLAQVDKSVYRRIGIARVPVNERWNKAGWETEDLWIE